MCIQLLSNSVGCSQLNGKRGPSSLNETLRDVGLRNFGVANSHIILSVKCNADPNKINETTARTLEFLDPKKMELIWLFLNPLADRITEILNDFLGEFEAQEVTVEFLPNAVIQQFYGGEINDGQDSHVLASPREAVEHGGSSEVKYLFGLVANREGKIVLILNGEILFGLLGADDETFNEALERTLRSLVTEIFPRKTKANPAKIGLQNLVQQIMQTSQSYLDLAKSLINHVLHCEEHNPQQVPNEFVKVISDILSYYFLPECRDNANLREVCNTLANAVLRERSRGSWGEQLAQLVSRLSVAEHFNRDNEDPVGFLFQSLINNVKSLGQKISEEFSSTEEPLLNEVQAVRLALGVAVVMFMVSEPIKNKVQISHPFSQLLKCFSFSEEDPVSNPGERTRTLGLGIYILLEVFTKLKQYGLREEILRRFGAWFVMSVCPEVYEELVRILFNSSRGEFKFYTSPRGLEQGWCAAVCLARLIEETLSNAHSELGKFEYEVTPSSKGPLSLVVKVLKVLKVIKEFLEEQKRNKNESPVVTCRDALKHLENSDLRNDCVPDIVRCRVVVSKSGAGQEEIRRLVQRVAIKIFKALEMFKIPGERAYDKNALGDQLQDPNSNAEILVMDKWGYRMDSSPTRETPCKTRETPCETCETPCENGEDCNPKWHPFYRVRELLWLNDDIVPQVNTVLEGI